ncbi:Os10g0207500, partial [Oryza sativa Japonica Group]
WRTPLDAADAAGQLLGAERGGVPEQRGAPPQRHPDLQRGNHQRLHGVHGVRRPHLLRRVCLRGARRPQPVPAYRLQRLSGEGRRPVGS